VRDFSTVLAYMDSSQEVKDLCFVPLLIIVEFLSLFSFFSPGKEERIRYCGGKKEKEIHLPVAGW